MNTPGHLPIIQFRSRPGVIDLGWGHPAHELLPVAEMRQAVVAALDGRGGRDALAYGAGHGPGPLLEWLMDRIYRLEGRAVAGTEILITAGISYGLGQLCQLYTRPGDVVLVEAPTYHLAMRILRDGGLTLVPVATDQDGLRVDAVAETCSRLRERGQRPRLLYVIPTFHNPTGTSLALERRHTLVALAAAEQFLIVEDDAYRELSYQGPPLPSLWSLAPSGTVARLGSFAKSLAPGLRLGWLTADDALIDRIVRCGVLDSGGGINHFTAMAVAELCASGAYQVHLERLREAYRKRRDALLEALAENLPCGCEISRPKGGYFIWLTLPEGMDAAALLPHAEAQGVAFLPGTHFFTGGGAERTLRLSFSLYAPDELAEAARRLGEATRTYSLRDTHAPIKKSPQSA